jgi:ankyrin repeat protein
MNFLKNQAKLDTSIQGLLAPDDHSYKNYSQGIPRLMTGLHLAGYFGIESIVKLLLDTGADVEAKDGNGQTPLLWVAQGGNEAVVKLLLDAGADIEAKDSNDQTPLLRAAKNGHEAIVKLLLDKGVDINVENANGQTALLLAVHNEHSNVSQLLMMFEAPELDDSYGLRKPLQCSSF